MIGDALPAVRAQVMHYRARDRADPDRRFREADWRTMLDLYLSRAERRSVSITEVASAAHVPPTTALSVAYRLQGAGMIAMRTDPRDRRRTIIWLSADGRAMVERAMGARKEVRR